MDPSSDTTGAACRGLFAHAVSRLSAGQAGELRRSPPRGRGEPFSAGALKHFDEQTLVVLAALEAAIRDAGLPPDFPFDGWGVLAAPRYLGRAAMVTSMARFHAEGAWGVSPHMVPYRSLHSISGTASQFLQAHGPNFGVGGGAGGVGELFLAGLALLEQVRLPGLWLVASRIEPDGGVGDNGRPAAGASCEALALALAPEASGAPWALEYAPAPPLDFDGLAGVLEALANGPRAGVVGGGGRLSAYRCHAVPGPHFSLVGARSTT